MDEDEDINISDNHYNIDVTRTPDSEISPESAQTAERKQQEIDGKGAEKRRMFYMSSEENSEAMESPSEANGPSGTINFKLPMAREFEMNDYTADHADSSHNKENRLHSGGPNFVESELSKSWSPDSERTMNSVESDLEDSPNPLYKIRHESFLS